MMKKKNSNTITFLFTGLLILAAYILGIGCPIKYMTGISCPGCGMTRAVVECFKLNFEGAWHYHPLVYTLPAIIIVILAWKHIPVRVRNIIMLGFIVAYMAVYVVRLFSANDSIVTIELREGFFVSIIRRIRAIA